MVKVNGASALLVFVTRPSILGLTPASDRIVVITLHDTFACVCDVASVYT